MNANSIYTFEIPAAMARQLVRPRTTAALTSLRHLHRIGLPYPVDWIVLDSP